MLPIHLSDRPKLRGYCTRLRSRDRASRARATATASKATYNPGHPPNAKARTAPITSPMRRRRASAVPRQSTLTARPHRSAQRDCASAAAVRCHSILPRAVRWMRLLGRRMRRTRHGCYCVAKTSQRTSIAADGAPATRQAITAKTVLMPRSDFPTPITAVVTPEAAAARERTRTGDARISGPAGGFQDTNQSRSSPTEDPARTNDASVQGALRETRPVTPDVPSSEMSMSEIPSTSPPVLPNVSAHQPRPCASLRSVPLAPSAGCACWAARIAVTSQ